MARNSEMIRQWEVLRDIDAAQAGVSVARLAAARRCHPRTIRRDLDALSAAGFPLYDVKINGSTLWKLRARPFRGLEEAGLSLGELCALHFSRTLLAASGASIEEDAERAFLKVARALPPSCRTFLDALPVLMKAKVTGRKVQDDRRVRDCLARLSDAALHRRRVAMRYHSHASGRTIDYVVEPLRLESADGGVYLCAFVPGYDEIRHFAVERIRTLRVLDERFEPRPLPAEAFPNSLGVYSGPAERVEIEFDPAAADCVTGRLWHRSQACHPRGDGSVLMRLDVCVDDPLRRWILGFGAAARVIAPARLARAIAAELEAARRKYQPAQAEGLRTAS